MKKKLRRILATVLSVLMVAGVVLPVQAKAQEGPYDPFTHLEDAYAYAYGGLLDLRLLNKWLRVKPDGRTLTVAELRGVEQLWTSPANDEQAPEGPSIDVELLELIYLDLGAIQIPLLGGDSLLEPLFSDINLGLLKEYASAPAATNAHGASGVINGEGGLAVTNPADGPNATINLLSLLSLEPGVKDLIQTAGLELGAISAVAKKPEPDSEDGGPGVCGDLTRFDYTNLEVDPTNNLYGNEEILAEEHERICSDYQIADAKVIVKSSLVGDLVEDLESTLGGLLDTALTGALGPGGLFDSELTDLLSLLGLDVTITVNTPIEDTLAALLTKKLTSSDEIITVDLATGEISLDLARLYAETPGGPQDLNDLDPNSSLLTSAHLTKITESLTSLLTADSISEPNGLIARLEEAVQGENRRGGLYATELVLDTSVCGPLVGCIPTAAIHATLGGLLNQNAEHTTSQSTYKEDPYDYYYSAGLLGGALGVVLGKLLSGVGLIAEKALFGPQGVLGGVIGDLQAEVVGPLLTSLDGLLDIVLDPVANIIVNRQTLQEVEHGAVFTVSALEINVLDLATTGEVIHLPLATASVMAQHWNLIDLNFDVAKVGDGRDMYLEGYNYDFLCATDDGWVLDEKDLPYDKLNVGSGYSFDQNTNHLNLTGTTTAGLATPLRVQRGAKCTVTANPAPPVSPEYADALRPTAGDRTPYTYFLGTDATGVLVSGDTPTGQPTSMSSTGVTLNGTQVKVDATDVGAEWKTHSFTFVVPEDAESHRVSVVHAYDIDTRDIDITKAVAGASIEDKFAFQYSLDGGGTWLDVDTTIGHGETLTIKDVPVLNESLTDTTVMVREALGANPAGPLVSWKLNGADIATTYGDGYATTASFVSGPVATVPTPKQQIDITNSYAEISVDKHIDGLLDGIGSTTLLPAGEDQMTIRYTVENTGAVAPDTITIYDLSLINDQFTPPTGITVDPTTGAVSGCELTFVDGVASCAFTVTLTENFSHYKADEAEATIVATTTIGDRVVTAEDTDKHGALRLPDFAGMLPATGSQTLVWVMGLGLLVALAALVNYVRNRRN